MKVGLKPRICHISTVHPVNDIRIFEKECRTLRRAGYEVSLLTSHKQNEEIQGVKIIALPHVKTRLSRFTLNGIRAYRKACETKAELYHFHDPELIPVGLLLSMWKKKVIYDVHEDLPRTILNKDWVPPFLRRTLSSIFEKVENFFSKKITLVITATPTIRDRFLSLPCKAIDVKNYPMMSEFQNTHLPWNHKERAVCYVGSIDRFRGIVEMTTAIGKTDGKLFLAGTISPEEQIELVKHLSGWKQVEELGHLDRSGVARVLSRSMAGLVLIHPRPNYLDSLPIKMFEYMSAGIPVIASNFPLWQKLIQETECGLCCDPLNPEEIASAIQWIFDHPQEARKIGEKGRKAVRNKYNWESESKKLLAIYEELLQ